MSNVLRMALAMTALLALAACARPSMYEARPPDLVGLDVSRGPAPAFRNAITVGSVTIGEDTGVPWRSDLSPPEIQETLVRTLALAGLGAPQGGRFRLDATLLTLSRPYAGFAMTVTAQIAYRLSEVATGKVVYFSTLTTLGTATLDDAITNTLRLRIADERAVRANLRALVGELFVLPEPVAATPVARR
ncbi:MAG: hypothetical protein JOY64_12805 [Alphaproteobacteria bacterium]|nr:hypothetical protein [Alphaproteobacteria bacterium]